MDATYFEKFCLICYQDNFDGYTQLIRFTDNEDYLEMKEDLENLIKLGIQIESTTLFSSYSKNVLAMVDSISQTYCWARIEKYCFDAFKNSNSK